MIRTAFVTLVTFIMTMLLGPVVVVSRLLGVPQGQRSIYSRSFTLWSTAINRAAGVRVRVHGAERIENTRGVVICSNHVSWFDIFPLAQVVPWCSFVAKAELRRIPAFGASAASIGIIFLDRDNRKQAFELYKQAAIEIQQGRAVVVCPEGTRGVDYHLRPFKKGPFVLAIAAQAPIVPTIVYGGREVMAKGSWRIRPGTVDIHFLEPVPTAGYTYEQRTELMELVWNRMADGMRSLYGTTTAEHSIAPEGARIE